MGSELPWEQKALLMPPKAKAKGRAFARPAARAVVRGAARRRGAPHPVLRRPAAAPPGGGDDTEDLVEKFNKGEVVNAEAVSGLVFTPGCWCGKDFSTRRRSKRDWRPAYGHHQWTVAQVGEWAQELTPQGAPMFRQLPSRGCRRRLPSLSSDSKGVGVREDAMDDLPGGRAPRRTSGAQRRHKGCRGQKSPQEEESREVREYQSREEEKETEEIKGGEKEEGEKRRKNREKKGQSKQLFRATKGVKAFRKNPRSSRPRQGLWRDRSGPKSGREEKSQASSSEELEEEEGEGFYRELIEFRFDQRLPQQRRHLSGREASEGGRSKSPRGFSLPEHRRDEGTVADSLRTDVEPRRRWPSSSSSCPLLSNSDEITNEWWTSKGGADGGIHPGLGAPGPDGRGHGRRGAETEESGVKFKRNRLQNIPTHRASSFRARSSGLKHREETSPVRSQRGVEAEVPDWERRRLESRELERRQGTLGAKRWRKRKEREERRLWGTRASRRSTERRQEKREEGGEGPKVTLTEGVSGFNAPHGGSEDDAVAPPDGPLASEDGESWSPVGGVTLEVDDDSQREWWCPKSI